MTVCCDRARLTSGADHDTDCANAKPARRRYPLVRVAAGDYLLIGNDDQTLWRITSYHEDGSLETGPDPFSMKPVVGTFWSIATYRTPMPAAADEIEADGGLQWDRWTCVEDLLPTRRAAAEAIAGPA